MHFLFFFFFLQKLAYFKTSMENLSKYNLLSISLSILLDFHNIHLANKSKLKE